MADSKKIYLDHAAATPMHTGVIKAMRPYFRDQFYNPSANYSASLRVAGYINQARADVASILGVKSSEVIFTAGGTEANNLAIMGVANHFPGAEFISTQIEHESVLEPLKYLNKQGRKVIFVKPRADGTVDPKDLQDNINDKTVLISVMYANNEIGTVQPIKQIGQMVHRIRTERLKKGNKTPLFFHSDACQAGAYLSLNAHKLGVDLMTLNGGKIYGPKQSGILFVGSNLNLEPIIRGGGQERGLRSGTENVPSIIGFARALTIAQKNRHSESLRLADLQKLFIDQITKQIPKSIINGSLKHRLPNNVHVSFNSVDNERLQIQLDNAGIYCGLGSACSALKGTPSHVLKAVGAGDEQARASLRFTMGNSTKKSDIQRTIKTLASLLN